MTEYTPEFQEVISRRLMNLQSLVGRTISRCESEDEEMVIMCEDGTWLFIRAIGGDDYNGFDDPEELPKNYMLRRVGAITQAAINAQTELNNKKNAERVKRDNLEDLKKLIGQYPKEAVIILGEVSKKLHATE